MPHAHVGVEKSIKSVAKNKIKNIMYSVHGLPASSRLPLNVTRHNISEVKSEIEPWIEKKLFVSKSHYLLM